MQVIRSFPRALDKRTVNREQVKHFYSTEIRLCTRSPARGRYTSLTPRGLSSPRALHKHHAAQAKRLVQRLKDLRIGGRIELSSDKTA